MTNTSHLTGSEQGGTVNLSNVTSVRVGPRSRSRSRTLYEAEFLSTLTSALRGTLNDTRCEGLSYDISSAPIGRWRLDTVVYTVTL